MLDLSWNKITNQSSLYILDLIKEKYKFKHIITK